MVIFGEALADPFVTIWNSFVKLAPGVVAAVVILIVGFIVAEIVYKVLIKLFEKVKMDKFLVHKTAISRVIGNLKLSNFLATILKWFTFVLFLPPAAALVQLRSISTFLMDLAYWIPNLIVAIIIILLGLFAANYVSEKMHETKAKSVGVFAELAKFIIIIVVAMMALRQIGIDVSLAENSFLIILGGVMLALAIAFGLGMKDDAKGIIKKMKKHL